MPRAATSDTMSARSLPRRKDSSSVERARRGISPCSAPTCAQRELAARSAFRVYAFIPPKAKTERSILHFVFSLMNITMFVRLCLHLAVYQPTDSLPLCVPHARPRLALPAAQSPEKPTVPTAPTGHHCPPACLSPAA